MSDTDKDKPWWTTATWWEPVHWCCDNDVPRNWRAWRHQARDCDLPARPVRSRPERHTWRWYNRHQGSCTWWPVYERRRFRYKTGNPPRWYVHDVWTGVERASVRDDCRRAIAEYRADGRVDVEPSVRQHRHCAKRLWD